MAPLFTSTILMQTPETMTSQPPNMAAEHEAKLHHLTGRDHCGTAAAPTMSLHGQGYYMKQQAILAVIALSIVVVVIAFGSRAHRSTDVSQDASPVDKMGGDHSLEFPMVSGLVDETPTPGPTPTQDPVGYISLAEFNYGIVTPVTVSLSSSTYSTFLSGVDAAVSAGDASFFAGLVDDSVGVRVTATGGLSLGTESRIDAYSGDLFSVADGVLGSDDIVLQGYFEDIEPDSGLVCLELMLFRNEVVVPLPTENPASRFGEERASTSNGDTVIARVCEIEPARWMMLRWTIGSGFHELVNQLSVELGINGKTVYLIRP